MSFPATMSSFPLVIEHCSPSKTGHFYLAETGHYHSAVTRETIGRAEFRFELSRTGSRNNSKGMTRPFRQQPVGTVAARAQEDPLRGIRQPTGEDLAGEYRMIARVH